jgi:hypothetical protein
MNYPAEAYAPDGVLWWELTMAPDTRRPYGVERKLCAWLRFNKDIGDTFTTKEARLALGEPKRPNDDEHFQRRLRELRNRDGWDIPSRKYDSSLQPEQYRVDRYGWHPGSGQPRQEKSGVSDALRAEVLKRDGSRCVLCGIGNGEPFPDRPGRRARLQAGHALSGNFGGSADIRNLRTECDRCNEPIRSEGGKPESPEEIEVAARRLSNADRQRLADWIETGHRIRDATDLVYDRYRRIAPGDQEIARAAILRIAGRLAVPPNE